MAPAPWLRLRKPGMAVGRRGRRRSETLCADREGTWEDNHRVPTRRSDAIQGHAGDSAGALDYRQHWRHRIPGVRARGFAERAHGSRLARGATRGNSALAVAIRADR